MTKDTLLKHVEKMLLLSKNLISGKKLVENTGKVNVKGDNSIDMDVKIEKEFVKYLRINKLPVRVFSEEAGIIEIAQDPEYMVVFDPLDGSTNYKIGNNLLPYGCLVAFFKKNNPTLNDVVVSGAIEFTMDLTWFFDGKKTLDKNKKQLRLKDDWIINKSTPVYLDLYYKEGYDKYSMLPEKVFVRNTGSTIGNLSYLLSNSSAGLGGVCMRPEEIGAVYSLIKGTGGVVLDDNGKDLGSRKLDFGKTYPILAGSKNVIEFCSMEIYNE